MAKKEPSRMIDKVKMDAEDKFLATDFPKGTVFKRRRSRYAEGRFWAKGELSEPLKKRDTPPGRGWEVHFVPDDGAEDPDLRKRRQADDDNTMSRLQRKKASKPEGA
jgi:hypothetical protein